MEDAFGEINDEQAQAVLRQLKICGEHLQAARGKEAQLKRALGDYEELRQTLQTLPERVEHKVMVPFGKMAFKNRLDSGMARSIFDSERQLADAAVRTHPALKKMQNSLEWGYKVVDREIMAKEQAGEIEKQKVIHVTRSMIDDGFINQAGKKWDEILEGATKKAEELF